MSDIDGILASGFYQKHGELLCASYRKFTGEDLLPDRHVSKSLIQQLFNAHFALVSHGTEEDPIFNFGNQFALNCFEISWDDFVSLPSRKSAEPLNREARAALMKEVTENGYIDNYSGVRISAKGNRFIIEKAIVWNLIDEAGIYHGQAAMFKTVQHVDE